MGQFSLHTQPDDMFLLVINSNFKTYIVFLIY